MREIKCYINRFIIDILHDKIVVPEKIQFHSVRRVEFHSQRRQQLVPDGFEFLAGQLQKRFWRSLDIQYGQILIAKNRLLAGQSLGETIRNENSCAFVQHSLKYGSEAGILKSLHRENSGGRLFVYLIGRHKGNAEIAQETAYPFFLKRLTISRFQEMDTFNGLAIVSSFFIIFR